MSGANAPRHAGYFMKSEHGVPEPKKIVDNIPSYQALSRRDKSDIPRNQATSALFSRLPDRGMS
jgi:hypothetical protein